MRDTRNAYKVLVGNPQRKKPLGRRGLKIGNNNIRKDFTERGCEVGE
jgi:hypothetical protein